MFITTQFCLRCYEGCNRGGISSWSLQESKSSKRIEVGCNPLSSNVSLNCLTACGDSFVVAPLPQTELSRHHPTQVVCAHFHFMGEGATSGVQYPFIYLGLPKRSTANFLVH